MGTPCPNLLQTVAETAHVQRRRIPPRPHELSPGISFAASKAQVHDPDVAPQQFVAVLPLNPFFLEFVKVLKKEFLVAQSIKMVPSVSRFCMPRERTSTATKTRASGGYPSTASNPSWALLISLLPSWPRG